MSTSTLDRNCDFSYLDEALAADLEATLELALKAGVRFPVGQTPLDVFRHAVDVSIRDICAHPRGTLLQRLLVSGPIVAGDSAAHAARGYLSDDETAAAIAFLFSFVVNSFQGLLAELLSVRPVLHLLDRLKQENTIPPEATLFAGDIVMTSDSTARQPLKGPDFCVLTFMGSDVSDRVVVVHALGEIKSYRESAGRIRQQLNRHLKRCCGGLTVAGTTYSAHQVQLSDQLIGVWVEPANWKLPRNFRITTEGERSFFSVDRPVVSDKSEASVQTADGLWRLTLRWSHEALAENAFAISFAYLANVGEVVFAEQANNPWPEMTPAQAGQNAAQQALYYAMLRTRSKKEAERATALWNVYSYGLALGKSFRGPGRQRREIHCQDLRQIAASGVTSDGFRFSRS